MLVRQLLVKNTRKPDRIRVISQGRDLRNLQHKQHDYHLLIGSLASRTLRGVHYDQQLLLDVLEPPFLTRVRANGYEFLGSEQPRNILYDTSEVTDFFTWSRNIVRPRL